MKKLRLLSLLLLVSVLLTGCLSPKVNFTISPNPILVAKGDTELKDLSLKVKLSGFSFSYTVEKAVVELKDHENKPVFDEPKTFDINQTIAVFWRLGKELKLDPISLAGIAELAEEAYDEALQGKKWTLEITLTGKNPTSATAKVHFE